MQSKLETVLKDKQGDLKLYQKFEGMLRFCERSFFPLTRVPLQKHIEDLKEFIEKLFPEPLDRREEMFSGEVFVLLCTLYLHDLDVVGRHEWSARRELLDHMEGASRMLLLSSEMGKRLRIPEAALELVNSLIFSVKKTPLEWEIREDKGKTIVRNGRVLGEVFNFAHFMWDIFSPDGGNVALGRGHYPDLRLRCTDSSIEVDSREGVIRIRCRPETAYQEHVLLRVRPYVESRFRRFKETVNGRFGFQYRQIVWDIGEATQEALPVRPDPGHQPFEAPPGPLFVGWNEASQLLDKLFRYGHAIVVGDGTSGKTTLVYEIIAQALHSELRPIYQPERNGDIRNSLADISIAKRLLGYSQWTSLEEGLSRTVTWYEENPELLA